MNPGEHAILARVEESHWWYEALRGVMTSCLTTPRFALPEAPRILEAGCGTGRNLREMMEFANPSYVGGFDTFDGGLEIAAGKAPSADLYHSDICDPEIHTTDLDLIISTDVIYIPGAERALPGLRKLAAALRPGGLFLVNLPAYDWLFSEHDLATHTTERYTARSVTAMLNALDLRIELLTYRVCFLFPAAVASRLPTLFRARHMSQEQAKSDFHSGTSALTNSTLLAVMKAENRLISRGIPMPWGTSVFAIARRV